MTPAKNASDRTPLQEREPLHQPGDGLGMSGETGLPARGLERDTYNGATPPQGVRHDRIP